MYDSERNGLVLLMIGAVIFCIGLTRFFAMVVGG